MISNKKFPSIVERPILEAYRNLAPDNELAFVNIIPSQIIDSAFIVPEMMEPITDVWEYNNFLQNLINCWLKLFSVEAIEQRANNYFSGPLTTAVVVQKSLASELSGFIYSVSPDPVNLKVTEIKALYGLSTKFLNYSDSYKVDKESGQLIEKFIVPQSRMIVRQGKNGKANYMEVNISEAWQKKQKLVEKLFTKFFQIMAIQL